MSENEKLLLGYIGYRVIDTQLAYLRYIVFSNRQIEDVPDYLSFLMVVLSLVNLLVCTVVKPFSAVFIAYAHATVSN